MSKTRLAIVGASVRAAAQSAIRAGFDVVGADLFADADLDGVCPITKIPGEQYPDALEGWLAEQDVDAWMYTGALENYPDLVDRMAEIASLWGVSGEALRRCRDPMVLQEVFRAAGVEFPETRVAVGNEHQQPDWLAKTYRHSNGAGVWRIRTSADCRRAVDVSSYAQRAVAGREYGASFSIDRQGRVELLGVTETITRGPQEAPIGGSFRGAVGPVDPAAQMRSALVRVGNALASELELLGPIGVDIVGEGSRWSVIEVNPRYTASIEVLTHRQAELIDRLFPNWDGAVTPTKARRRHTVAKAIVYSLRSLVVSAEFASWANDQREAERLADTPRAGQRISRGEPVCTCLVVSSSPGEVKDELQKRKLETLEVLYRTTDC